MYAGDVSVAILIIILILLTFYKVCGVWQNILNFKQVLNTTIAATYLYVKVLHVSDCNKVEIDPRSKTS